MTGEKPGSINDLAAETGRDPDDPSVFADFTHALGQWRKETVVEEIPPTMEFAGLFLGRHLVGSSARTSSDLPPLEGYWGPTTPVDSDALAAARNTGLLTEQMLGLSPPPDERNSCDR
jgi:hypothetical protein